MTYQEKSMKAVTNKWRKWSFFCSDTTKNRMLLQNEMKASQGYSWGTYNNLQELEEHLTYWYWSHPIHVTHHPLYSLHVWAKHPSWPQTMWSDETEVELFGHHSKSSIAMVKHGGGGITLWFCFSSAAPTRHVSNVKTLARGEWAWPSAELRRSGATEGKLTPLQRFLLLPFPVNVVFKGLNLTVIYNL